MGFGRIGGMLVIGGGVLFMIAAAIVMGGGSVGLGLNSVGGLLLAVALALVGSGAAGLSVVGPRPLNGRAVRVGLGILAVGLLSSLASSAIAIPAGSDALESLPFVVSLIGGLLATVLGSLITGLSLVRRPGPSRAVGSLLLAGMLLLVLTTLASPAVDQQLQEIGRALAVLGALVIVLGGTGVGVLAINGSRSAPVASL